MRLMFPRAAGIAATICLTAGAAFAHHGWSNYGTEDFELAGTVESADFGGSHDELTVEAEDGVIWDVILSPPSATRAAGLTAEGVKPGDEVTALGKRHKDENRFEMKTERLTVDGEVYDLYPDRLND